MSNIYSQYYYRIRDIVTGQYYSGSKYGKDANSSLFWKENGYFTSSSIINDLIQEHGTERFEVCKLIHMNNALSFETRFLQKINAAMNPLFYNESNNNWGIENPAQNPKIMNRIIEKKLLIGKDGLNSFQRGRKKQIETMGEVGRKISAQKGVMTKRLTDEDGTTSMEKASKKCSITKMTVGPDGLTNAERSSIKGEKTKSQIQENGLTIHQAASRKGAHSMSISEEDGLSIRQKADQKRINTRNSPEWIADNTYICSCCNKEILGKGNLRQHENKCWGVGERND